MKKKFLFTCTALGVMLYTTFIVGQNLNPTVLKYPDKNQGYFVFNKRQNLQVNYWTLTIQQQFEEENVMVWKDMQIIRTHKDFVRLPQEYMMPQVATKVIVRGINSNGTIVTDSEWQPAGEGNNLLHKGTVRCEGPTYIWELQVYDKLNSSGQPTGQGAYLFTSGGGQNNAVGNYVPGVRGFQASQNLLWLNTPANNNAPHTAIMSPKHHGYDYWVYGSGPNEQGAFNDDAYFPMNNIQPMDNIRDANTTLITGNAFVVYKREGFWIDKSGHSFVTPYSGSHALSQMGCAPSAWIPLINEKLGIQCACNPIPPAPSTGGSTPGENDCIGCPTPDELLEKQAKFIEEHWATPVQPVFPSLEGLRGEFSKMDGYEHDNDIPWWPANEISHLLVFPVCADGQIVGSEPIIQISKHLVVNSDGSINNYNFTLEPGLYTVKMYVAEYGFMDMFFEVEQTTLQAYPQSNYLSVDIFPVPLGANQTLSVVANSSFNLNYNYILTDEQGNILDTKTVRSRQGEEMRFIFDSKNLPIGQLFHKFVFADGSVLIYNTLKM